MSREATMNTTFIQTMTFRCTDAERLVEMATEWDVQQATSDIMGYVGMRMLADSDDPDRYMIVAEFGVVDPEVSAAEEALRSNERPQTQASIARLRALVDGEVEFHNYNEVYRTNP
jgi:hypothetical protein